MATQQEANVDPLERPTPEHVPSELVWPHSLDDYNRELEDPFVSGGRLHDGPDIFWAKNAVLGDQGWVLTRQALIQEAFTDTGHFSSSRQVLKQLGEDWKLNPLEYDPPQHYQYRKILNPFFTPVAIARLNDSVMGVCQELMERFADRGSCEFISDFAEDFMSYIFLDFMNLPRDMQPQFLEWERGMLDPSDPMKRVTSMKAVMGYLQGYIDEQRENPTTDMMKGIFAAEVENGRPLNPGEIMGMVYLIYVAGLDTVLSTMGWVFRYLAGDQALQDRLRENPDDIKNAVEEFLRAFGVATPHREVTEDFNFHGVEMKKGDYVFLATYLASRDPQAYENPHQIDIDRKSRHVTLAAGPHICLGANLARRELRTVIEAFVTRFKNIRIPEGEQYKFHCGGVLGVDYLPLEWDPV